MSSTIARNKKAYFDYTILKELEAGIVLTGGEVKSIKSGSISLKESFVRVIGEELWLINANVAKWPQDTTWNYDPTRSRKLLIGKSELEKLSLKAAQQGCTLIPLSVYTKRSLIKVKVGLARGKKKYERKQSVIERQSKREMQEELKRDKL